MTLVLYSVRVERPIKFTSCVTVRLVVPVPFLYPMERAALELVFLYVRFLFIRLRMARVTRARANCPALLPIAYPALLIAAWRYLLAILYAYGTANPALRKARVDIL